MGVPKRREIAAYLLLYESAVKGYGEAISLLSTSLCLSRKTAVNVLKRLKRMGAVKVRVGSESVTIEIIEPREFLGLIAGGYVEARRKTCRGKPDADKGSAAGNPATR